MITGKTVRTRNSEVPVGRISLHQPTHEGHLEIADLQLFGAVLSDGRRVVAGEPLSRAMENLRPGTDDLELQILSELARKPCISFRDRTGRLHNGLDASMVAQVVGAHKVLNAERGTSGQGATQSAQPEARTAIGRFISQVLEIDLIGLIDSVTGYATSAHDQMLRGALNHHFRQPWIAWIRRFPNDFFQELLRLRKWTASDACADGGRMLAVATDDVVFARLDQATVSELMQRKPKEFRIIRRPKANGRLPLDVGHPALIRQLQLILELMRMSDRWEDFLPLLDRAAPRHTPAGPSAALSGR